MFHTLSCSNNQFTTPNRIEIRSDLTDLWPNKGGFILARTRTAIYRGVFPREMLLRFFLEPF